MFINQMTPIPGASSGNGNPGFFISWILLPLFYFMVILWVRIFRVHSINIYVSTHLYVRHYRPPGYCLFLSKKSIE